MTTTWSSVSHAPTPIYKIDILHNTMCCESILSHPTNNIYLPFPHKLVPISLTIIEGTFLYQEMLQHQFLVIPTKLYTEAEANVTVNRPQTIQLYIGRGRALAAATAGNGGEGLPLQPYDKAVTYL